MTKRKLQVFISSTYIDLKDERQAAVEAILGAGHIPAGMELFKAGNNSQLATIKKWIDQSDIYMLILGGRYGSVEEDSGKSYTQLEYEYAINKNIPVFAVVLSDDFLQRKSLEEKSVYEEKYQENYKQFKDFVKTKMIKEINEIKDIQIAIYESLKELEEENDFSGWLPGALFDANPYFQTHRKQTMEELEYELDLLKKAQYKSRVEKTSGVLTKSKARIHFVNKNNMLISEYVIPMSEIFLELYAYLQNGLSKRKIMRILNQILMIYSGETATIRSNKIKVFVGRTKVFDSDLKIVLSAFHDMKLIGKYNTDFSVGYKVTEFGVSVMKFMRKHIYTDAGYQNLTYNNDISNISDLDCV